MGSNEILNHANLVRKETYNRMKNMSQITQAAGNAVQIAIVGKSALFPVALVPKVFWPNLISLKGLMTGLATSQWPFSEFFSAQDLKNLKNFIMKSGIMASGGLPTEGFEIPPEILQISTILPIVSLFLAKQALDDTQSFQKGSISADKVRVVMEALYPSPVKPGEDTASTALPRPNVAELFARHFGFSVNQVEDPAPLPGTLAWLGKAIRGLQNGTADLVIAGSVDAVHPVLSWAESLADPSAPIARLQEGIGMITLRRLSDAERDGDQVYAVISGFDASSISFIRKTANPVCQAAPVASAPALPDNQNQEKQKASDLSPAARFARFARLPASDIIIEKDGSCRNLPFNSLTEDGSNDAAVNWKLVRECWVKRAGSRRFFHDLLGALFGTFVSRVVLQNPNAFYEVASRPLIFLANHQIGLESPLFMALAYGMIGLPIQAVAKPDHVNAWLSFLLAFAQDSLGEGHPFRLMLFDRQNPLELIENLKRAEKQESSLLVHVEGTRSAVADQPVTRMSSIFLDMAIDKNIPMVPLRFVGGLPDKPLDERLDFPFGNGKQDYLIGAPILPEQLKKMPYGQRPRFIMEMINTLGPGKGEDILLPPDKTFEAKTRFFIDNLGFPKMQAMLFAVLQKIDDPCAETAQLVKAIQSGKIDPQNPDIPLVLKNFLGHIKAKLS